MDCRIFISDRTELRDSNNAAKARMFIDEFISVG